MLLSFSSPDLSVLLTEMARQKRIVIGPRTSNASLGALAFRGRDPAIRAQAMAERNRRIAAAEREKKEELKISRGMEVLKAQAKGRQLDPEELRVRLE